MTSTALIEAGICEDLGEVFDMFPLEMLDDFGGMSQMAGVPGRRSSVGVPGRSKNPQQAACSSRRRRESW